MPYADPAEQRKWEKRRREEHKALRTLLGKERAQEALSQGSLETLLMREKREDRDEDDRAGAMDALPSQFGAVAPSELKDLALYDAHRILKSISDEDIRKAPLQSKVASAAKLVDRYLLLSGQPTEIHSIKELGRVDELAGLMLEELKRRKKTPKTIEAEIVE